MNTNNSLKKALKFSSLSSREQKDLLSLFATVSEEDIQDISTILKRQPEAARMLLENFQLKKKIFATDNIIAWKMLIDKEIGILKNFSTQYEV